MTPSKGTNCLFNLRSTGKKEDGQSPGPPIDGVINWGGTYMDMYFLKQWNKFQPFTQ